jgi:hypothetical protein
MDLPVETNFHFHLARISVVMATISKINQTVIIVHFNHFGQSTFWTPARAWSYQQKFSDLRNFQKTSENFKPSIFVRNVRKII